MRKLILTAAVLAFAGLARPASATQLRAGWDAVAFGGVTTSDFTGSDRVFLGTDARTAFTTGLGAVLRVNDVLGFEMDVRYTEKGGKGLVDVTDYSKPNGGSNPNQGPTFVGEGTTKLGYVEIPILMAAHMPVGGETYVRGYAGPSFNILTRAEFTGTLGGVEVSGVNLQDGLKSFDGSLVIGASFVYDPGKASGWVDARWNLGLSSISDTAVDRQIKNRAWEFAIGVGIPLARE